MGNSGYTCEISLTKNLFVFAAPSLLWLTKPLEGLENGN